MEADTRFTGCISRNVAYVQPFAIKLGIVQASREWLVAEYGYAGQDRFGRLKLSPITQKYLPESHSA